MKTPILGASYTAKSVNAATDRCVNLYPETVKSGGRDSVFLSRCPGLRKLAITGTGPVRGAWQYGGKGYCVSGNALYEIDANWNVTKLGLVDDTDTIVSMADNGKQLFIACGKQGFIYSPDVGAVREIMDQDFPGADTVIFLDGYFVFTEPDSQKIWVTTLYDGFKIDGLDFASSEALPDNNIGAAIDHRELWLFGETSTEVWYDAGGADFPLQRIQGAFIEMGCAARRSVAKIDNAIFWLGSDARGGGIVLRSNGYNGQRISDHGVEYAISTYPVISDAIALTYRQGGHSFYVLTFPTAGKTWVYDAAVDAWHERGSFINEELTRYRANCIMHFNGEIVVGDAFSGDLFALDQDYYSEDGAVVPWIRAWRALPPGANTGQRSAHHSLTVFGEMGVGLEPGDTPVVWLRWSDDGGHTWSKYHQASMGKIGEYGRRLFWRRLGMTMKLRDRVYEISGSDPVKVVITGAEIDGNGTAQ